MKHFYRIVCLLLCLFLSQTFATAQQSSESQNTQTQYVEMADVFRQDGKIYVVVAVVSIVLGGLFLYLIRIERKITHIEKTLDT